MTDDTKKGWTNDPDGHARTDSQSSGTPNPMSNLSDEDKSKGGKAQGYTSEEPEDMDRKIGS